MKTILAVLLLAFTVQAQQLTVLTDSKVLRLVDEQGREVGSFTLPAKEPITLTIRRHVRRQSSGYRAMRIDREDARAFLNGRCLPPVLQADSTDTVTVIVAAGSTAEEWTAALVLALGIVPPSRVIEIDEPIPAGFEHLDIIDHRSHPPFREQRVVGQTPPRVRFCQ